MKIYLRETYCTYESCIFYLFNILFNTLFKVNVYKTTTTKFTTFTSTTKKPNKMNKLKLIKWDLPFQIHMGDTCQIATNTNIFPNEHVSPCYARHTYIHSLKNL